MRIDRRIHWLALTLGLGLYVSSILFGYQNHNAEMRMIMFLGLIISTASFWNLFAEEVSVIPVLVIFVAGCALMGVAFFQGILGDTHSLFTALPAGVIIMFATWRDIASLFLQKSK